MKKVTKIIPNVAFASEAAKLRVAAYCRVSTDNDEQLESLETQIRHYESAIRANPEWEFIDVYYDEGITGTKKERRPGLLRMIADCEGKKIDLILTKSISRFARNTTDCLELVRKLLGLGIFIHFEKENIHTGSMESELMLSILSGLAEGESVSISDNNKWAVNRKFQDGTFKISCPPYGYDAVDGQLIMNETEAGIVRFIFAEVLSGKGAYTIAKELNRREALPRKGGRWSEATVRGMIRNEAYTGDVVMQKTFTDASFNRHMNHGERDQYLIGNNHKAIISRGDFDAAQAIVAHHAEEKGIVQDRDKYRSRYSFSGLIICAQCGSTFKRRTHGISRKYIAWCCATHLKEIEKCSMKFVPEADVEVAFVAMMNKLVFGHKAVLKPLTESLRRTSSDAGQARIRKIDQELEENEQQQKVLVGLRAKGYLDPAVYSKGINELLADAKRLQRQKETLIRFLSNGNQHLQEVSELLHYAARAEMSTHFDGDTFTRFVNRIHVYSRSEIGFELKCGLTLNESLAKPIPSTYRLNEGTERFDDSFQQAEYAYRLIQTEEQNNGCQ